MHEILDEIYYTISEDTKHPPEWAALSQAALTAHEALLAALSPDEKHLFEEWLQKDSARDDAGNKTLFYRGVTLGLALGALS